MAKVIGRNNRHRRVMLAAANSKPAVSVLLAAGIGAEALLLFTDVDAVYLGFGTDAAKALGRLAPEEARGLDMPKRSMGLKLRAASNFADHGGVSGIGRSADAMSILDGTAGTRMLKEI